MVDGGVPRLVPEEIEQYSDKSQEVVACGGDGVVVRGQQADRVRRRWLNLPVVVLAPGEVLSEEAAESFDAGRYVFQRREGYSDVRGFSVAQRRQMVKIYGRLPRGTRMVWQKRQGFHSAVVSRWRYEFEREEADRKARCAPQFAPTVQLSRFSPGFIRAIVDVYSRLPQGQKGEFLAKHGFSAHEMSRWRRRIKDGTAEMYFKREGARMGSYDDELELMREQFSQLAEDNKQLRAQLQQSRGIIERQTKALERADKTSELLGKVLASMPDLPGVDYDAVDNSYPKTKNAAMRLVDRKNNSSSTN